MMKLHKKKSSEALIMKDEYKERLFYLDFIRVFSCLCILIIHFNASASGFLNGVFSYPNGVFPNYLFKNVYLGDLGVSLFFMISGTALMTAYKHGCTSLSGFYKKRFLALYPMFWLAFFISISFSAIVNKSMSDAPGYHLIFSALGMDGYLFAMGITGAGFYQLGEWFLGCIILLYLLYPMLSYGVRKSSVITTLIVIVLYGYFNFVLKVSPILFVVRIPQLLLGMLFARYYERRKRITWCEVLTFTIIGIFAYYINAYLDSLSYQIIMSACVFIILVYIAQLVTSPKIQDIFSIISKYTYAAFLIHHQLISYLVRGWDLANLHKRQVATIFISYIVLTAIFSIMLFRANRWLIRRIHNIISTYSVMKQ